MRGTRPFMHAPPMPRTVFASGLTKDYGDGAGVFDLNLEIDPGSIVGFVGPSGSGKTTAIRLMTGVMKPDSGQIEVLGERPVDFTRSTRARLGYMPQHAILYPDLTLRENLNFAASLYGMPYRRKDLMARLVEFVELEGAMDRLPRQASGGEKRRVMLASTLIHDPELIFLDEPTAGIDPVLRRKFWERFRELADDERTLLVTTQYVGEAAYCDHVAVLAEGRILTLNTPQGLRKEAYGGDQYEVAFAAPPPPDQLTSLARLALREPEWIDSRTVRLVVEDATETGPAVSRWAEERGVDLEKSEAYQAEYDDVFVELVSRLANGSGEERDDV